MRLLVQWLQSGSSEAPLAASVLVLELVMGKLSLGRKQKVPSVEAGEKLTYREKRTDPYP